MQAVIRTQHNRRPGLGSPLFLTLLGLYTAQSVVSGIVNTSLPVILRDLGMSLNQIGLMSLLTLPWALKILWAPLVDRYYDTISWILGCQVLTILCFVALSGLDITQVPWLAVTALFVIVFATGTQDVATDAIGIHATGPNTRTVASGASSAGGYLGYLIGGGAWLWVYATYGWTSAVLMTTGILAILTIPALLSRTTLQTTQTHVHARLRDALSAPLLRRGLLVVLVWQGAMRLTLMLSGTILVDAGLSIENIALLRGGASMGVGLLAAFVASALAQKIGLRRLMQISSLSFVVFCLGHILWTMGLIGSLPVLVGLHLGFSVAISFSFVAIYALMMGFCDTTRAATDFSILQALDVVLMVVGGIASGLLAEQLGYAAVFSIAAVLMAAAYPVAVRLSPPAALTLPLKNELEFQDEI